MSKILHILLTDYKIDSRVKNETESLHKEGYDIDVFCLKSNSTEKRENRRGVGIFRYGFLPKKIPKILTAYIQFIIASMKKDYRLVHAHDVTALPIGFIISRLKSIPLIYDSHELWSESEHERYPGYVIRTAHQVERFCARRCECIVTVSDSINQFLRQYFKNRKVVTVRNIPSYVYPGKSGAMKEQYKIPEDIPIFMYQGAISNDRGIDVILKALKVLQGRRFVFVFLGDGPAASEVQHFITAHALDDSVLLLKPVSQDELIQYIRSADIGVHAIANTCLNHEFCLPNKIFEYIHGGVGVVCTNVKEMAHLVESGEIGVTFKSEDSDDLARTMERLIDNRSLINRFKNNSEKLSMSLTWQNEFLKLERVYRKLLTE